MITILQNTFLIYLKNTNSKFRRYMHKSFDMNEKLIGIIGSRGVGKTTFILPCANSVGQCPCPFSALNPAIITPDFLNYKNYNRFILFFIHFYDEILISH